MLSEIGGSSASVTIDNSASSPSRESALSVAEGGELQEPEIPDDTIVISPAKQTEEGDATQTPPGPDTLEPPTLVCNNNSF